MVKTYPNPSNKYTETVCVAGIDLDTRKLIRLYPIPHRYLDEDKKFKKYDIIEIKAHKSSDDHRPESYKVDSDSIKVIATLDTKNNWQSRKKHVMPVLSKSFCEIRKRSENDNTSLGLFKPERVKFQLVKRKIDDEEQRAQPYRQEKMFSVSKQPIEQIPFEFRYSFYCFGESNCPGHDLMITDWELYQSYRKWRALYKTEQELSEKMTEKWQNSLCAEKQDTYFFVGNMKVFHDNFLVLGVFYPPKSISSNELFS